MESNVKIGLMGLGTVGTGVFEILQKHRDSIARRAGGDIDIVKVLVNDKDKKRDIKLETDILTTNAHDIIDDPEIDVVVELIGCPKSDVEPARTYICEAMKAGKHVVTANKEVLAKAGPELFALAAEYGVGLHFEAAVAGGVPIIKSLRECLVANDVETVIGIINGTTNYMLTKMAEEGSDFDEVLNEAREKGYAEADPTSDVEGHDAAYKLAILASLAFETKVDVDHVYREGITRITPEDMAFADELGYAIKLLAVAKSHPDAIEARVHPTLVPKWHPLASVRDVFNAIFIEGDSVGELMFYGRGAGKLPTGSAVVADIVEAAQNLRRGVTGWLTREDKHKELLSPLDVVSRYYIHTKVVDYPGVLARIAQAFGDNDVSLAAVIQKGERQDPVSLAFVTHRVTERNVQAALREISRYDIVRGVANVIRVEGE